MTADCVVGTVAQYAHKFSYLFHSISQTVYYNRPSYIRQRQIPLARLLEPTTAQGGPKAVNLLALLVELAPDIPVLFEHTGAGHRETHARHRWAWVLWLHFVLCEGASPTRDVTTFLYLTAVLACTPVFFYLRRRSFAR
jgi:hypothetical protein